VSELDDYNVRCFSLFESIIIDHPELIPLHVEAWPDGEKVKFTGWKCSQMNDILAAQLFVLYFDETIQVQVDPIRAFARVGLPDCTDRFLRALEELRSMGIGRYCEYDAPLVCVLHADNTFAARVEKRRFRDMTTIPKTPLPIEQQQISLEDLSNAVNGALGNVAARLRQQNWTGQQIELLLEESLEYGLQEMRRQQEERLKVVPMIEVVQ